MQAASEAALASVSIQGAGNLRRLGPLLQRPDPPLFTDGLAMDRVLQPLQERLKLVDSLLQGFDAPLVRRNMGLGTQIRCPPSSTQLNDTPKDRDATNWAPAGIAGTRHSRNLPLPPSQEPREGRRKQDPTSGTERTGLVTKTTRPPTCPEVHVAEGDHLRDRTFLRSAPPTDAPPERGAANPRQPPGAVAPAAALASSPESAHDEGREEQEPRIERSRTIGSDLDRPPAPTLA
jgi:hypothetical protein